MSIQERIARNLNRKNDVAYMAALDEVVRKQQALLDKGLSVKETFEVLGDVQVDISEKFQYGLGFVAEDTVKAGLRVRD